MSEVKAIWAFVVLGLIVAIIGLTIASVAYDDVTHNNQQSLALTAALISTSTLIFAPGYSGVTPFNVFTSWPTLYAHLTFSRPTEILFTDVYGNIEIPARDNNGVWDMTGVAWVGNLAFDALQVQRTTITIQDGAVFRNLAEIRGGLLVQYVSSVVPCMTRDTSVPLPSNAAPSSLVLEDGAMLQCTGSMPFVQVNLGTLNVTMSNFAVLESGNVFRSDAVSGLNLIVGESCVVNSDSLAGSGDLLVVLNSLSAVVSMTQSDVTGTITYLNSVSASLMQYTPASLANWNNAAPTSVADALDRIAAFSGPIT